MATYGFIGAQGYGKSLAICEIGLYFANRYNRAIASNFPLNIEALWEYLIYKKYWNLCKSLEEGRFFYFPPESLIGLLSVCNAEIFLDEAAHQLGSRHYQKNKDGIVTKLSQIRKKKSDLLYAVQNWQSIDPELRRQTHYVLNCEGALIPDLEGYPKLVAKDISWHTTDKYQHWYNSPNRNKFLFRKKHQEKRWVKPIKCEDLLLFKVYDSTLDLSENIESKLPKEYRKIYFQNRLEPFENNYCFTEISKNWNKGFKIQSSPPNWVKFLNKESCLISKNLEFYWKHLIGFPSTFFPILIKIPGILAKAKILNLKGHSIWKGKYKKIF